MTHWCLWSSKKEFILDVGMCVLCHFSRVRLCATPWTVAHQAPLSMEFSRQESWSGLLRLLPGDLSDPGIKPTSHMSPASAGGFFINGTSWEAQYVFININFLPYFTFYETNNLYCVISNKKVNLEYIHHLKKTKLLEPCLNITRYSISWFQISEKDVQEIAQDHEFVHCGAQTSMSQ